MTKLLPILFMSILLSGELEVDGDLKVTGTIQASTIDSLLSLIAQLEMRISQLECQNTGIIPDGYCDCFFHTLDECGVCNGDNTVCADCAGVPNGDSLQDMCGYCDNDSSNDCVQDCFGEWGGSAVEDVCGECGGDAISEDECDFSLRFDGVDDYVIIDNSIELNNTFTGYHPFTVSLWIYDLGDPNGHIFGKGYTPGNGNPKSMMLFKQGNTPGITFLLYTTEAQRIGAHANGILVENEWTHIVASYDGYLEVKMYQNGEYFPSSHLETGGYTGMHANNEPVYLGSRINEQGSPHNAYNGFFDNSSIFDRQLSDNEIQMLFNNGNNIDNLIGSWNFNEGTGSTLNDLSGNGNHGTIYGAEWVQISP